MGLRLNEGGRDKEGGKILFFIFSAFHLNEFSQEFFLKISSLEDVLKYVIISGVAV